MIGEVGRIVAANVRLRRMRQGLSVRDLSALMTEIGRPLVPSGVTKLEQAGRHIDVDDLAALATVLDVDEPWELARRPSCGTCAGAPPAGFTCNGCGGRNG